MHIRLHSSCGADLGRSIAVVTNNIQAIGVVEPVYERSTFPLTATAVQSKGHAFKNLQIILLIEAKKLQCNIFMYLQRNLPIISFN